MGWLCAHCLFDRRVKPRLTDVLLRAFHHVFSGSTIIPLNTVEARVLCEALSQAPAEAEDEGLREAIAALHAGIDAGDPTTLMSDHLVVAAVEALRTAVPGMDARYASILAAVAEHLAQWQHNPDGLGQDQFASRVEWRQAVLRTSSTPTARSERTPLWSRARSLMVQG